MAARPSSLLAACLMGLLLGAALAKARRPQCPGGKYARTPDKFAPCTCGYRPGPGGGDCKQWNYSTWCFEYQKPNGKVLNCNSRVSFFTVDSGSGPRPQFDILKSYCDPGFKCRNSKVGPWCCPR